MSGSSEHAALERRVNRLADNLTAAQAIIDTILPRVEAIEDALQMRHTADVAHGIAPRQPQRSNKPRK